MKNLQSVIKTSEVSEHEIAGILFPNNKYPNHALNRVIKGETELKYSQIASLANRLDVTVESLFNNA
tara:strand:+ start:30668 stop:30868 length:201 start_codon:yes stop_codon:yes gene_type:complete